MMLDSNVPNHLMQEILQLVPDAFSDTDEYWRIVPNTAQGYVYSVSSKRDILVRHTSIDKLGRTWKPQLCKMSYDSGVFNTSIRRASNLYSTYIHHIRNDAFPELNTTLTLDQLNVDPIDIPYDGLEWYNRHKTIVHILPVSDQDMQQVRRFYPTDLPREIWAYVPNTNNKYVVSSQARGVILQRYCSTGTILQARKWQLQSSPGNYYQCTLTVGDKQTNTCSHIVILSSFIPKPDDDKIYEVNHINGDGLDNVLDNLEWVTRQQNSNHYNKSPEMTYKRAVGYKKISEFGRAHQKEIQNRPEVNAKRSATLKSNYTEESRIRQSEASKDLWKSLTDEQKHNRLSGLRKHNELQKQKAKLRHINENKINSDKTP